MSRLKTMNEQLYTGRCEHGVVPEGAVCGPCAFDASYKTDNVNQSPHYKQGSIEAIEAIEAALTKEEFRGYCKGNALKYIWREKHKGQDESIRKAIWYLNRVLMAAE